MMGTPTRTSDGAAIDGAQSEPELELELEDGTVRCPICAKPIPSEAINNHLDHHLEPAPTTPSAPSTQSTLCFQPHSNTLKRTANPKTPVSQTLTFKKPRRSTAQVSEPSSLSLHSSDLSSVNLSSTPPTKPLAERVRPKTLEEFLGQPHLRHNGTDLSSTKSWITNGGSLILWGPPGSGKTTLARCLSTALSNTSTSTSTNATAKRYNFHELSGTEFSAVEWKKILSHASGARRLTNTKTVVFVDEVQRLNKGQQDLFLPHIESGELTMVFATTENPSFRLTAPLLSRCRLLTLHAHRAEDILLILNRALSLEHASIDQSLLSWLAEAAEGDARVALSNLDLVLQAKLDQPQIDCQTLKQILGKKFLLYDRDGDNHYDLISALHKSVRGGDANAGLYWLARMLEGGEDPLYVARRLVRMASEDIGLANPMALTQAVSAYQATQLIGMPECDCILAQIVVMLAESPKSVRTYKAYKRAQAAVSSEPAHPVPVHLRNAPTKMMKDLGYGAEYRYEPGYAHPVFQTFLPPDLSLAEPFLLPPGEATGENGQDKVFDEALLEEWEEKVNGGRPWAGRSSGGRAKTEGG